MICPGPMCLRVPTSMPKMLRDPVPGVREAPVLRFRLGNHYRLSTAAENRGQGTCHLGFRALQRPSHRDGTLDSTDRALLEYKFLSEGSKLRPYIGVGVNYTTFYDRDSTAAGNAASGGPTKLSLTSSVGPAATVGLAYNISGHIRNFYASYSASRVNTHLVADTGGVIRTTDIKFGLQAAVVAVGYSF